MSEVRTPQAENPLNAPAALARNGKLAQQLLDSAPDAMVIVNQDGRIIIVNRQTEQLFGYKRHELLDQPVEMLMPERFRARHIAHRATYAVEPRLRSMGQGLDLFGCYRDSTEFPVEISLSPLRIGGQLVISAAIRDVTERKAAQIERESQRLMLQRLLDLRTTELASKSAELEVAETMASIGTLAAGLVHDLNNALFPIRSRLQAIREQGGSDQVRQHVDAVEPAMEYIAELAKRVRMLLAHEEDGERDAFTVLHEWWREVQPLMTSALPKEVQLQPEIPIDLPPVRVRRLDLTQAVFNLAHNAGRVLRNKPSAIVKIWAKPSGAEKSVRVGVTDNGPGMPPEVKEQCLDPLCSASKQCEGSGIGLMLVKSIVSRAKGSIDIDSEPDKGTTFTLVLPAKQ